LQFPIGLAPGEVAQVVERVRTRGDDEDHWGRRGGVGLCFVDLEERRVHEVGVHDFTDLLLDGRVDLVRANGLLKQQLFEGVQQLVPLSRQSDLLWFVRVLDGLEFGQVLVELIGEAFEAS